VAHSRRDSNELQLRDAFERAAKVWLTLTAKCRKFRRLLGRASEISRCFSSSLTSFTSSSTTRNKPVHTLFNRELLHPVRSLPNTEKALAKNEERRPNRKESRT
jgi:hypothetical protein